MEKTEEMASVVNRVLVVDLGLLDLKVLLAHLVFAILPNATPNSQQTPRDLVKRDQKKPTQRKLLTLLNQPKFVRMKRLTSTKHTNPTPTPTT